MAGRDLAGMDIEREFAAATKRIDEYINRCVGQKLRRARERSTVAAQLTKTAGSGVGSDSAAATQQETKA